jgi:uncharacterized protein YciI
MAWFVKIERGIVDKEIFDLHIPAHKAYVEDLIAQGHQAKTGYWQDSQGGMLLFTADSLEEAKQIVAKDPLIQNNCVTYELHPWCIVRGEL